MATSDSAEVTAIEGAYSDQIKKLYGVLVSNLVDGHATGTSEQKSVERFLAGARLSKRARDLAVSALAGVPATLQLSTARVELGMVHANSALDDTV